MVTGFAHHAVVKCVARADLIKTKTTLQTAVYLSVVSVSTSVSSYPCIGIQNCMNLWILLSFELLMLINFVQIMFDV